MNGKYIWGKRLIDEVEKLDFDF